MARTKILSKNQHLVLENWKVGEEKLSSGVSTLKNRSLGGVLSGLERSGHIQPIWREGRQIRWKRIK
jgi:hypothetical protein